MKIGWIFKLCTKKVLTYWNFHIIASNILNSQCSNSISFVGIFPCVLLYKIETIYKYLPTIIFSMKIKIIFLVPFAFGQTFLDFEILPKYNETCDSPENAKLRGRFARLYQYLSGPALYWILPTKSVFMSWR